LWHIDFVASLQTALRLFIVGVSDVPWCSGLGAWTASP
jgi:hypothetical protein